MRYMVIYSHQIRNKEGKKIKRIDKLFKKVECDSAEEAKEKVLNQLEEEEKILATSNNKNYNRNTFLMDYKIIDVVKQ